jgi:hypothetical protein
MQNNSLCSSSSDDSYHVSSSNDGYIIIEEDLSTYEFEEALDVTDEDETSIHSM